MPGLQRDPVQGVATVPGDISEPSVLIQAEVIGHVDRSHELRAAGRVQGDRVHWDAHEGFLRGRGVVDESRLRAVADAVDSWLRRRRDPAVGIPGHAVVRQPDPGRRTVAAFGQVYSPD